MGQNQPSVRYQWLCIPIVSSYGRSERPFLHIPAQKRSIGGGEWHVADNVMSNTHVHPRAYSDPYYIQYTFVVLWYGRRKTADYSFTHERRFTKDLHQG